MCKSTQYASKKMYKYIRKLLFSKLNNKWFCGDREVSSFFIKS